MEFEELLKNRSSAVNFEKDFKMNEDDFKNILALAKLTPSTYNLQPTKYLVVLDQRLKEVLSEISYAQHKIVSSSAMVIVLGDKETFTMNSAESIYSPMKQLGMIDDDTYKDIMQQLVVFTKHLKSDKTGHGVMKELYMNCMIGAAFFILSAGNLGFDTCPMHVVDEANVRELFNLPDNLVPLLMIAVGKSTDKIRARGYRRLPEEVLLFNMYK